MTKSRNPNKRRVCSVTDEFQQEIKSLRLVRCHAKMIGRRFTNYSLFIDIHIFYGHP